MWWAELAASAPSGRRPWLRFECCCRCCCSWHNSPLHLSLLGAQTRLQFRWRKCSGCYTDCNYQAWSGTRRSVQGETRIGCTPYRQEGARPAPRWWYRKCECRCSWSCGGGARGGGDDAPSTIYVGDLYLSTAAVQVQLYEAHLFRYPYGI